MLISRHAQMNNLRSVLQEDHWWLLQAFWRKVKADERLMGFWKQDIENGDGGVVHALESFVCEMLGDEEGCKLLAKAELLNLAEEGSEFEEHEAYWAHVCVREARAQRRQADVEYANRFM